MYEKIGESIWILRTWLTTHSVLNRQRLHLTLSLHLTWIWVKSQIWKILWNWLGKGYFYRWDPVPIQWFLSARLSSIMDVDESVERTSFSLRFRLSFPESCWIIIWDVNLFLIFKDPLDHQLQWISRQPPPLSPLLYHNFRICGSSIELERSRNLFKIQIPIFEYKLAFKMVSYGNEASCLLCGRAQWHDPLDSIYSSFKLRKEGEDVD